MQIYGTSARQIVFKVSKEMVGSKTFSSFANSFSFLKPRIDTAAKTSRFLFLSQSHKQFGIIAGTALLGMGLAVFPEYSDASGDNTGYIHIRAILDSASVSRATNTSETAAHTPREKRALDRLIGTQWENNFSQAITTPNGTSFYGVPRETEFGKVYPLILTPDGIAITPQASVTTTVLGVYKSVAGGGSTKDIIEGSTYPETSDFGEKIGGFNLLNVNKEVGKKSGDFWKEFNSIFLDEAIKRGDVIQLVSQQTVAVIRRQDGSLSGYGREIQYMESRGLIFHPDTMQYTTPLRAKSEDQATDQQASKTTGTAVGGTPDIIGITAGITAPIPDTTMQERRAIL